MAPNRPRGRKTNVTGSGKPIGRRGSGLGTGPVGGAGRGAGIGSPRPSGGSFTPAQPVITGPTAPEAVSARSSFSFCSCSSAAERA